MTDMFWIIPSHRQGDRYKRTGRQADIQEGRQSGSRRRAEIGGQLGADVSKQVEEVMQ